MTKITSQETAATPDLPTIVLQTAAAIEQVAGKEAAAKFLANIVPEYLADISKYPAGTLLLSDVVGIVFIWRDTAEGSRYWNEIFLAIYNREGGVTCK